MKYRLLGRTGVAVSEIGLGGNQFGTTCDTAATAAIIDRALALGVNFIDTAEMYGNGAFEEALGKALTGSGMRLSSRPRLVHRIRCPAGVSRVVG